MENDKLTPSEKDTESKSSEENVSDEASDALLEEINKGTKKHFKSIGSVVKTLKQQDKDFAEQGKQKKVKPKSTSSIKESVGVNRDERLLKLEHPDAVFVTDELRKEADRTKSTILEVWDNSTYFKREASSRAEESKQKKNAEGKISSPSGESIEDSGVTSAKGLTLSAADKEFMQTQGITAEEVAANIKKK